MLFFRDKIRSKDQKSSKMDGMNWDMIGHAWAVDLLQEHIRRGQLRHAYLLTGPRGLGKRTLALAFAKAITCSQPPTPGDFCGSCRNCTHMTRMQHPDLAVIQAEQEGGVLKVENIRELPHSLALTPYEASHRIALLLRFHEANPSAQNALLKTLEEPAPQVVLILTADSVENLLPTIVSRCEVIRLRPVPVLELEKALVGSGTMAGEQAHLFAHVANGRPGAAKNLVDNPEGLKLRHQRLDDVNRLLAASRTDRFAYIETLLKDRGKERETARGVLLVWLSFWRDVMLQCAEASAPLENLDWTERIRSISEWIGPTRARQFVASIQRIQACLDENVNTRLALEVLMLDLPFLNVRP
jgi:DNA polymerase III subunit delta'